jgi:hypothetical protein
MHFGLNNYGRLSYLIEMTNLRKKDKRLEVLQNAPNISESRVKKIEADRQKIFRSLKLKYKEL